MRIILTFPLLMVGACNVDNDAANDQMTVKYDQKKIERAAAATARTAKEVGSGVGNVAVSTGRAIKKEVGDIDVDVDVRRKRAEEAESKAGTR